MAPEIKTYIELMKKESIILHEINAVNDKIIAEQKVLIEAQREMINLFKESLNIK
jgi:hypothetical protein